MNAVEQETDHLFRKEYARLVSILAAKYGGQKIEMIEDAVQESLLKAMQVWGFKGIPENPSAWLYRVASNNLIDQIRRSKHESDQEVVFSENGSADNSDVEDGQLRMLFACCHPELKQQDQVILSLKILGGLHLKEIASGLLQPLERIKKQYQRALQKFRTRAGSLELPEEAHLEERLGSVLKVIYLIFNEGYSASYGEDLVRNDICEEALVLTLMLHRNKRFNTPDVNAMLALICFSMSRTPARLDKYGQLVTLADQDRSKWDRFLIQEGLKALERSTYGIKRGPYHMEAGISGLHATARNYEETDWKGILQHYDILLSMTGSPIVALNRVVAFAKVHGNEKALNELTELEGNERLQGEHLLYSIKGQLMLNLGREGNAKNELQTALEMSNNNIERAHLKRLIDQV